MSSHQWTAYYCSGCRYSHYYILCQEELTDHPFTSKYADGLPLYRLEHMLKRLGHEISRTSMAHWVIRLDDVFKPLINLMREVQNSSDYLQADESRMYVLKEDGKTAQSDKWMWVTRGGPPGKPSVLFEYDPSRAGKVPVRLLDDFKGVLQADGYSGYGKVCRDNGITRIGCWDNDPYAELRIRITPGANSWSAYKNSACHRVIILACRLI